MRNCLTFGLVCTFAISACATPNDQLGLNAPGTDFYNPYRTLVLDNGPVGLNPCASNADGLRASLTEGVDVTFHPSVIQGSQCAGSTHLFYPGVGNFAFDQQGNRVKLSRADRKRFAEQFDRVREQAAINQALTEEAAGVEMPPPVPSAPPVSSGKDTNRAAGPRLREPARDGGSLRR